MEHVKNKKGAEMHVGASYVAKKRNNCLISDEPYLRPSFSPPTGAYRMTEDFMVLQL